MNGQGLLLDALYLVCVHRKTLTGLLVHVTGSPPGKKQPYFMTYLHSTTMESVEVASRIKINSLLVGLSVIIF